MHGDKWYSYHFNLLVTEDGIVQALAIDTSNVEKQKLELTFPQIKKLLGKPCKEFYVKQPEEGGYYW